MSPTNCAALSICKLSVRNDCLCMSPTNCAVLSICKLSVRNDCLCITFIGDNYCKNVPSESETIQFVDVPSDVFSFFINGAAQCLPCSARGVFHAMSGLDDISMHARINLSTSELPIPVHYPRHQHPVTGWFCFELAQSMIDFSPSLAFWVTSSRKFTVIYLPSCESDYNVLWVID